MSRTSLPPSGARQTVLPPLFLKIVKSEESSVGTIFGGKDRDGWKSSEVNWPNELTFNLTPAEDAEADYTPSTRTREELETGIFVATEAKRQIPQKKQADSKRPEPVVGSCRSRLDAQRIPPQLLGVLPVRFQPAEHSNPYILMPKGSEIRPKDPTTRSCRRMASHSFNRPVMPPLPAERVFRHAPFESTGVDYLGPTTARMVAGQPIKLINIGKNEAIRHLLRVRVLLDDDDQRAAAEGASSASSAVVYAI
uniref:Uncharacterized protein n=1 Tax=Globodera rostochiensis TaxID=31243 RepID=A0A914HMR6_GLORO